MNDVNTDTRVGVRVLVVEDDRESAHMLAKLLEGHGYEVDAVESGEGALDHLEREQYGLVLLDLNIPNLTGLDVLARAPAQQMVAQFIVMTGYASIDTAVEAMRLGAFDYITKPLRTDELLLSMERALSVTALQREVAQLRRRAGGAATQIIGSSPAIESMFDMIERVAATRATVLISGETGTGKELAARAIHDLSPRRDRKFVPVNCSALSETLLESELFGHVKGSFTGAVSNRVGLFEVATGGTVFLDEISAVPPATQVKLLRVLQERQIQRVGTSEPIAVDFRVIAATNVDLAAEVADGDFRQDLYYRLNVFPIRVPPLKERKSDIPLLATEFRNRFARENEIEPPEILPATMARMMEYDWPGNVRQLENFVMRTLIRYSGEPAIRFEAPDEFDRRDEREFLDGAHEQGWDLKRLERGYIMRVLEQTGGHQTQAAEILGIDRRTLYRKLKHYRANGLLPDSEETSAVVDGGEDH